MSVSVCLSVCLCVCVMSHAAWNKNVRSFVRIPFDGPTWGFAEETDNTSVNDTLISRRQSDLGLIYNDTRNTPFTNFSPSRDLLICPHGVVFQGKAASVVVAPSGEYDCARTVVYSTMVNSPPFFIPLAAGISAPTLGPRSAHSKQDLNPFSRFCRAQTRDRLTDTPRYGNIGCNSAYIMYSTQPSIMIMNDNWASSHGQLKRISYHHRVFTHSIK